MHPFPPTWFLYIDPGTGSLVLQIIIGGFLGILFVTRRFFSNVKEFFAHLFRRTKS